MFLGERVVRQSEMPAVVTQYAKTGLRGEIIHYKLSQFLKV